MIMIKKMISLCFVCALMCSSVFASEPSQQKTYTLTLQEAIAMATSENPQIAACEIKKEAGETSVEVAKTARSKAKKTNKINFVLDNSTSVSLSYITNGYAVSAAEMAVRLADLELQQIHNQISYQVTEKYFNVKLAEQLVAIYQNAITMAEENYNLVQTQLALGMVSELELQNAEIQLLKTKLSYENTLRNIALAKEDLKIALQLNGDCDFILTDEITYKDFESDVNTDIANAMKTRYDVNALKEKAALDELYFTITDKVSAANTESYQSAQSTYLQSNYNYANSSRLIGLSVRASYNNIATTKGNLDIATMNLKVKEREYETAELKFRMGMLTNIELTKTLNELLQCRTELENSKLSYKLAVEKYQYEITFGL